MSRAATLLCSAGGVSARCILRRVAGPSVITILCYHDIGCEPAPGTVVFDQFRAQLDILQRDHQIVDIGAALAAVARSERGDRQQVAITFDDATAGAIGNAIPELERRRLPYTVFVIADEARKGNRSQFASLESVRDSSRGFGTIGAHSVSHRMPMTRMTDDSMSDELRGSMEFLEQCGVRGPRLFCYPWAAYDDRVEAACRKHGFDAAFAGQWLRHHSPARMYRLGRVTVDHDDDLRTFAMKLAGARDAQALWLEWKRAMRRRSTT